MSQTIISDFYFVNDSERPVRLKVKVTHAQVAATTLRLGNGEQEHFEDSFEKDLGPNKSLKDQRLFFVTSVTDIQKATDKTGLEVTLEGGPEEFRETLEKKVSRHGGTIDYIVTIDLL